MHTARDIPYEACDAESHILRIAKHDQQNAYCADNNSGDGKPVFLSMFHDMDSTIWFLKKQWNMLLSSV